MDRGESKNRKNCCASIPENSSMSAAHTKAGLGISKTVEKIAAMFKWDKMREDVKILSSSFTFAWRRRSELERGGTCAKGVPEHGEIVYMDLVEPISLKISSAKYLLTMIYTQMNSCLLKHHFLI